MSSRVYSGGCLTPGQITALEFAGIDEQDIVNNRCRVNNTCGRSVKDILADPDLTLYDPQKKFYTTWGNSAVPWSDESDDPRWGFASFVAVYSYAQGTKIAYLGNNGHRLYIYQALENVEVLPGDLDLTKWVELCYIDSHEQIIINSYDYLVNKYPYFNAQSGGPYTSGQIVLYDSVCGNLTCVFLATGNIPASGLSPLENSLWKRTICLENGKPDKCVKTIGCDNPVALSSDSTDLICLANKGTNL